MNRSLPTCYNFIVFLGVWRNASRCRVESRCWKLAVIFWKHFWPTKFDYSLSCREWESDRSNRKLYKVNGLWITISDLIDASSQWNASCVINAPHNNCLKILRNSQTGKSFNFFIFFVDHAYKGFAHCVLFSIKFGVRIR